MPAAMTKTNASSGLISRGTATRSIWKADFDGDDKQLARVTELFTETMKDAGGMIDGPYLPQDASLLYLAWVDRFEDMNRSGRKFLERVAKEKLPLTPLNYEIAVTPKEFWGK
jgi:hypothetical protein